MYWHSVFVCSVPRLQGFSIFVLLTNDISGARGSSGAAVCVGFAVRICRLLFGFMFEMVPPFPHYLCIYRFCVPWNSSRCWNAAFEAAQELLHIQLSKLYCLARLLGTSEQFFELLWPGAWSDWSPFASVKLRSLLFPWSATESGAARNLGFFTWKCSWKVLALPSSGGGGRVVLKKKKKKTTPNTFCSLSMLTFWFVFFSQSSSFQEWTGKESKSDYCHDNSWMCQDASRFQAVSKYLCFRSGRPQSDAGAYGL